MLQERPPERRMSEIEIGKVYMIGHKESINTRMHSSRMRTVRCSGRHWGRGGVCLGVSAQGVSAQG